MAGEIRWCQRDIVFVRENLAKWMEDEDVPGTEALNDFQPRITKEPIGTVLIIGYICICSLAVESACRVCQTETGITDPTTFPSSSPSRL
jgi:hypothetical protein